MSLSPKLMHRISNVQRKEETKKSRFGTGFSAKSLWNILQASPIMLVKAPSNVFYLLKNLSSNLSPSGMSLFGQRFEIFSWSGGNIVPSLLTATSLQRTQRGGVLALTTFPGRFPEKMGGAGNALLQYLYLTLYIDSHFSKKTHTKGVRLTRSWLCFSRTHRVSSCLTHFPAHYFTSGCAESV